MKRQNRLISWLVLTGLLLQLIIPLAPTRVYAAGLNAPTGLNLGALGIAQSDAEQPIQALLIFNTDTEAAQSIRSLLDGEGVAVALRQLSEDTIPLGPADLYIPDVHRAQAVAISSRNADDSLNAFDLIILGDDLEVDGQLVLDEALRTEILQSERPVLAMGRGGARFLLASELLEADDLGALETASQVNICDMGAGAPLFQGETELPIDETSYALYAQSLPAVYVELPERRPQTRRLACAESSDSQTAIGQFQGRFALWGFSGAPDAMTETGRTLFSNLAWLLTGESVEIPLAAGRLRPTPGIEQDLIDELATGEDQYALVQLYRLPSGQERDQLAELGIHLLNYLANNIFSARIAANANLGDPLVEDLLRFAGIYRAEYKVSPLLESEEENGPESVYETILVIFFDDVGVEAITALLGSIFDTAYSQGATETEWFVPNDPAAIQTLAASKLVRFIVPIVPPDELNETARPIVQTDTVHGANIAAGNISYIGQGGQGITLGIFEGRPLVDHGDMTGRIIVGAHASGSVSSHATHVAGIMIGNGAISAAQGLGAFQRRGHAPLARLVTQASAVSPGSGTGFVDRFADSVLNHGVRSHNHSYVQSYGEYDGTAVTIDRVVRGDAVSGGNTVPPNLAVYAAGNNGQGVQYGNIVGFYSVFTTAKNSLSVGSTDANTGNKSNFSSKGPTYDGRIKPDVVAPGCRNSATNDRIMAPDTANSNTYGAKCGTSMAAPVVTGITGLMLQQYRETFGASFQPLPSSLKAILVNTAIDQIGTSIYTDPDCDCTYDYGVGPDWATGYGLVNAPAAIAAVRARNIIEGVVSPANLVDTYEIQVTPNRDELHFTLAWDDEPGDSSTAATVRKLVNDLDLVLIDPLGTLHYPWVLDALPVTDNPTASGDDPITQDDINNNPAYRDVNNRDNVEQVVVNNPMPGTWQIRVSTAALPNANPQPYSLTGDFRELRIVRPNTSNTADAGDPAQPNVILVRLEAHQPYANPTASAFVDVSAIDFEVHIDGTPADVINGLAVGDQFWLNVRPQAGVYSAGSKYDLVATWTGYGSDSKTRAVLFTEREITDRAVVIDYSGSMFAYDKMQAAQNAARLFIDQSLPGDRISVVGFSTDVTVPFAIQQVSNDPLTPELNAAKNAVDSLSPGGLTAIGPGMLEAFDQLNAPPADPGNPALVDVMILLSDGMENRNPRYDTPDVKGVIQPTDTIVHTVGVGPANAGFFTLLQTIAEDNDGIFISVNETTPGAGGASIAEADGSVGIASMGLDANPVQLPNRMAEAYKAIAEEVLRETRLFQVVGNYEPVFTHVPQDPVWRFIVPENTARLNLSLNWSDELAPFRMVATAPDEKVFAYDPKNSPDATCRADKTHDVCIIDKPTPGLWSVRIHLPQAANVPAEYSFWASAQTPVQFHLHIGTPPEQRLPGQPIHVIGFVHQNGKPMPGPDTTVKIKVFDAWGNEIVGEMELLDKGLNNDGEAGDGIFGGTFIAPSEAGPYMVRGQAFGPNEDESQFQLLANANFTLRPRVIYIHDSDRETAEQYQKWIQQHGIAVDLAHKGDLPSPHTLHNEYSLIIIGPDTAEWTDEQRRSIIGAEKRALMLGKGGHDFLRIYQIPDPVVTSGGQILVDSYQDDLWQSDYEFNINEIKLMDIYRGDTERFDVNEKEGFLSPVWGRNPAAQENATIYRYHEFWTVWGFQAGPEAMTDRGREVFLNTVLRAMR